MKVRKFNSHITQIVFCCHQSPTSKHNFFFFLGGGGSWGELWDKMFDVAIIAWLEDQYPLWKLKVKGKAQGEVSMVVN